MLFASLVNRQMVFQSQQSWGDEYGDFLGKVEAAATSSHLQPPPLPDGSIRMERPPQTAASSSIPLSVRLGLRLHRDPRGKRVLTGTRTLLGYWDYVMDREGVLGIHSEYFDIVVITRKWIAVSLQTYQAYMGSFYFPHRALNKFMVFTIVMRCISTPAIHFYYQQRHAPRERVLFLGACGAHCQQYLNAVVSADKYFDYAWLIDTVRDVQFLVADSAGDIATTFVALSIISLCMSAIKPMIGRAHTAVLDAHTLREPPQPAATAQPPTRPSSTRTGSTYSSTSKKPQVPQTVSPERGSLAASTASLAAKLASHKGPENEDDDDEEEQEEKTHRSNRQMLAKNMVEFAIHHVVEEQQPQSRQFRNQKFPITGNKLHLVHVFFLAWAVVVLFFHIRASRNSQQKRQLGCHVEVRPWSTHKYACSVLEYNCVDRAGHGSGLELTTMFLSLHRRSLTTLLISHCDSLEMPPEIQLFQNLVGIKFYNSTIKTWPRKSALTEQTHPRLAYVFFVRTTFPSADPSILGDRVMTKTVQRLALCETTNADNQHFFSQSNAKGTWPSARMLLSENTQLAQFPRVVASLTSIQKLSLAWNQIRELPVYAFQENKALNTLSLAGNKKLAILPQAVANGARVSTLFVSDTKVDSLPSWSLETTVHAERSPLCATSLQSPAPKDGVVFDGLSDGVGFLYPLQDEDIRFELIPKGPS